MYRGAFWNLAAEGSHPFISLLGKAPWRWGKVGTDTVVALEETSPLKSLSELAGCLLLEASKLFTNLNYPHTLAPGSRHTWPQCSCMQVRKLSPTVKFLPGAERGNEPERLLVFSGNYPGEQELEAQSTLDLSLPL